MHCQHCGRYHNEDTCPHCGPESDEAITVERGDWVSQEIADSEFTEAEIEAQMDLIDRVDEMDEEGVFDLDARLVAQAEAEVERIGPLEAEAEREAELDAFEWYKLFCEWRDKVGHDTGQRPTTTFLEWLDEGVYEAPGPGAQFYGSGGSAMAAGLTSEGARW